MESVICTIKVKHYKSTEGYFENILLEIIKNLAIVKKLKQKKKKNKVISKIVEINAEKEPEIRLK